MGNAALDGWFLVLPTGRHASNDDRDWNVSAADVNAALAMFDRAQEVPVFWGHPKRSESGEVLDDKEPVGWVEKARRTKAGLEAWIRWNDEGARLIRTDRARFFSPGARLAYEVTDARNPARGFHFLGLDHVALVTQPAFSGLKVRRLAASATASKGAPMDPIQLSQEQVAAIIGAAGLDPSTVTPEQLAGLISALEASFGVPDSDDSQIPGEAAPPPGASAAAPDAANAAAETAAPEPTSGTTAPVCPKCNTATPSGAAYCPGCGTRTKAPAPAASANQPGSPALDARVRRLETKETADGILIAAKRDLRKVTVDVEETVRDLVASGKTDRAKALLGSIEKGAPAGGRLPSPGYGPNGAARGPINGRDPKAVDAAAVAYQADQRKAGTPVSYIDAVNAVTKTRATA